MESSNAVLPFYQNLEAFSICILPDYETLDLERTDKIIMPQSALDILVKNGRSLLYLTCKLRNHLTDREMHCGVLEFGGDEDKVFLPCWMMRNLFLEEGGILSISTVSLPIVTYAKLQPQCEDFIHDINLKTALKRYLADFSCLTVGDIIMMQNKEKFYQLHVLETKPEKAVSIAGWDLDVDITLPIGYFQEKKNSNASKKSSAIDVKETDLMEMVGSTYPDTTSAVEIVVRKENDDDLRMLVQKYDSIEVVKINIQKTYGIQSNQPCIISAEANGKIIALNVGAKDTIDILRAHIQDKLGIPGEIVFHYPSLENSSDPSVALLDQNVLLQEDVGEVHVDEVKERASENSLMPDKRIVLPLEAIVREVEQEEIRKAKRAEKRKERDNNRKKFFLGVRLNALFKKWSYNNQVSMTAFSKWAADSNVDVSYEEAIVIFDTTFSDYEGRCRYLNSNMLSEFLDNIAIYLDVEKEDLEMDLAQYPKQK